MKKLFHKHKWKITAGIGVYDGKKNKPPITMPIYRYECECGKVIDKIRGDDE